MKTSVVGAPGLSGHRLASPQRAVAMTAVTNSTAAISTPRPKRRATVRIARNLHRSGVMRSMEPDCPRHEQERQRTERNRQEGEARAAAQVPGGAAEHRHDQRFAVADGEHRS